MFSENSVREDSWQLPLSQIGFLLQYEMESLESLKKSFFQTGNSKQFPLYTLYLTNTYREQTCLW